MFVIYETSIHYNQVFPKGIMIVYNIQTPLLYRGWKKIQLLITKVWKLMNQAIAQLLHQVTVYLNVDIDFNCYIFYCDYHVIYHIQ